MGALHRGLEKVANYFVNFHYVGAAQKCKFGAEGATPLEVVHGRFPLFLSGTTPAVPVMFTVDLYNTSSFLLLWRRRPSGS